MSTATDFALNQKTVPGLGFAAFLDLAAELGCLGVEPRNDLGRPFFDGLPPARAAAMARERGLRLLGLSEVYGFDDLTPGRRDAVAALIEAADAAGAGTISLIPRVDHRDPDAAARARNLRAVVAAIAPMLAGTAVTALPEPIGSAECSMKFQREAVAAIEDLGLGERFGILHDTFQHALAADGEYLVARIRMVHISGVAGAGALTDGEDAARGLLDEGDRTGAVEQIRRLIAAGYRGAFSFECTDPGIRERSDPKAPIAGSIAYLRRTISGADTLTGSSTARL